MVGHLLDIMGDGVGLAIRITICLKLGAIEMREWANQEKTHRMRAKVRRQETDP